MRSAPRHASSVGGLLAAALTVETYLYVDKCTAYEYRYTSHLRESERETKKKNSMVERHINFKLRPTRIFTARARERQKKSDKKTA